MITTELIILYFIGMFLTCPMVFMMCMTKGADHIQDWIKVFFGLLFWPITVFLGLR